MNDFTEVKTQEQTELEQIFFYNSSPIPEVRLVSTLVCFMKIAKAELFHRSFDSYVIQGRLILLYCITAVYLYSLFYFVLML